MILVCLMILVLEYIFRTYMHSGFFYRVVAMTVPVGGKSTSTMLIGTMEYWKLTMPSSGTEMRLHFQKQGGGSFPASYGAQLSVLRCPSASACP